jgi:hypothetical protein
MPHQPTHPSAMGSAGATTRFWSRDRPCASRTTTRSGCCVTLSTMGARSMSAAVVASAGKRLCQRSVARCGANVVGRAHGTDTPAEPRPAPAPVATTSSAKPKKVAATASARDPGRGPVMSGFCYDGGASPRCSFSCSKKSDKNYVVGRFFSQPMQRSRGDPQRRRYPPTTLTPLSCCCHRLVHDGTIEGTVCAGVVWAPEDCTPSSGPTALGSHSSPKTIHLLPTHT